MINTCGFNIKRIKIKYPRMVPQRAIKYSTHRNIRLLKKEEMKDINEQLMISLAVH